MGVVVSVGAVAVDHAGVPGSAGVYDFVAGFLAASVAVKDALGPRFAVTETRLVVVGEDAEDGNAEADGGQLLDTGGGDSLGFVKGHPAEVRGVNQQGHAGVDGGHHGLRADGVDLHQNANLLRFVHDGAEDFHFLGRRTGFGGERDLAGELDSHRGHLAHFLASFFGSVVVQANGTGGDNARSVDHTLSL